MTNRNRRQGFTLVEVMFAAVLSALVLGALYQIFYATTQQSYKVSAKYEAMRSSLTASEILSRELQRLVTLPVQEDDRGYPLPRHGDHVRPVRLGPDMRGVSFYVPAMGSGEGGAPQGSVDAGDEPTEADPGVGAIAASPLTIDLVPGPTGGLFAMRRSTRSGGADEGETGEDAEDTRVYHGVMLKTLRFRLLAPDADDAALRSPDGNYYLEAVIVGTDSKGQEESPLSVLQPLNFPSERRYDPGAPAVTYSPEGPLSPPGTVVNPTPEEQAAADELQRLGDEFRNGDLTPEDLVEQARTALDPVAGTTPTGPLVTRQPRIPPIPPDATVLTPPGPGPVVIGSPTGTGPTTVIPPSGSPPGSGSGGPGEATWTTWQRATVYDSEGNVVWQESGEDSGTMAADGSEWDQVQSNHQQQIDALSQEMTTVQSQMSGS